VSCIPPGSCVLTSLPLSYEVSANKITQTLLIPTGVAGDDISSVSVIGVASDGSGLITFVYFEHFPGESTTFIGLNLLLA
jgi:hypothetical protein